MNDDIGRQACITIGMQRIMGIDEDSTPKTNPNDLVMGTLTKREYFAAMVIQGYASRDHNKGRMICDYTYASKEAVERADELIEELNK